VLSDLLRSFLRPYYHIRVLLSDVMAAGGAEAAAQLGAPLQGFGASLGRISNELGRISNELGRISIELAPPVALVLLLVQTLRLAQVLPDGP